MAPLGRLALAGLLSIAFVAPQAWGQDCSVPIDLPDKPRISNFADYNDFVVEVMKYKKQKRAQQQHRKRCPRAYTVRERPNPDPTVIEGPETLGEALRRTQRLPEVDYASNQKWYNRSTSRSFGLPSLSGDELSSRSIDAHLQNLRASASEEDLQTLSDRERRLRTYQALLARREKGNGSKADGLAVAGADALPTLYASDFNVSGKGAGDGITEQLYNLLLQREQDVNEAMAPPGLFNSLSHVASTSTVRGQRLDVFIDNEGEPIKFGGLIQVEDCLSSCVPH